MNASDSVASLRIDGYSKGTLKGNQRSEGLVPRTEMTTNGSLRKHRQRHPEGNDFLNEAFGFLLFRRFTERDSISIDPEVKG